MLLQDSGTSLEKVHKYAGIIYEENKRLEQQVERVLNVAKLDKNELVLNKEAFDLQEILVGVHTRVTITLGTWGRI